MQITIQTQDYVYRSVLTPDSSRVTEKEAKKSSGDPLESVADFQKVLEKKRAALSLPSASNVTDTRGMGSGKELPFSVPKDLVPIFREASEKYGVDQKLLEAIAYHESRFKPGVTSSSGAMGLMQLMPRTAEGLGVKNAYDPYENIMGGAKLISGLIKEFHGNVEYALAAYSNGSSKVKEYGGVPPIKQAQEFVSYMKKVVDI
jgi:soluble lytic murein transglycosylase-like protein